MNQIQITENPKVAFYILSGLSIYLIYRILHFFIQKAKNKNLWSRFSKFLYLAEIFSWFLFISMGLERFYQYMPSVSLILAIALILISVWVSWFILRDYIAGLIIKLENAHQKGEVIKSGDYKGKIIALCSRHIEIEDEDSGIVKIPYSKLFISRPFKLETTNHSSREIVFLEIPNPEDKSELLESIQKFANLLPWTNNKDNTEVSIEKENNKTIIIKLKTALFDRKYSIPFKKALSEKFNSENFF
ncbi:MAG: mechanosensitive ion channel [Bacteroidales bacterium]